MTASTPLLHTERLGLRATPDSPFFVQDVALTIPGGECHIVSGPTGSGKSTLLQAAAGLLPDACLQGRIQVADPRPAVILQNPETQLLAATIGGECAFYLENLGWDLEAMQRTVRLALDGVGLTQSLSTPTRSLSMGQKYRLLLAAFLAAAPRLLLIDEAGTQLDAPGREHLAVHIQRHTQNGGSAVLFEQHPGVLASVAHGYWRLENGTLCAADKPPSAPPLQPNAAPSPGSTPPLLTCTGLTLAPQGCPPLVQDGDLSLHSGELVLLTGANGAGKSTLLQTLAGFGRPQAGRIFFKGQPPRPDQTRGKIGLVLQNPERQFFETTIREEMLFALKRLGIPAPERTRQAQRWLARIGLQDRQEIPPFALSYGQKRLLALATTLAFAPEVVLLDDPGAGLDTAYQRTILELLDQERSDNGLGVIWTAHDMPFTAAENAYTHIRIQGGRLVRAN